ncbi:ComEA family DNA-binding protein [Sedimentibacter sp.]|uniref:ComEA family DNA-binding protein n=1 Tax=Sedimentibacter sp. TaxID=1960295 RepID=UPI002898C7E2|nr:ComEA family DNA-binding protein [Sedimentibacter sp.]
MNNRIYKKGLAVVLIIALLIMAYLGIKLSSKEKSIAFSENIGQGIVANNAEEKKSECIFVDIDGAVNCPGVYELRDGCRVNDAIVMAGGLTDTAYTKNLNKARLLVDGEKIYVLNDEEINEVNSENSKLININTASKEVLKTLPGIGDAYAQRIIDYRSKKSFGSIEEIKQISGIGEKTFEKMKELITIGEQ